MDSKPHENSLAERALDGVKVLEYSSGISGSYCTKVMADLGAEVLKIEPPDGDRARRIGPFAGDDPHPEKSGLFLYLNTNKRGLTLDPSKPPGKRLIEELVKDTDVLVEDQPPDHIEKLGLGYDVLKKINPGLIVAFITPYGLSGPYRNYKAYNLNTTHISGQGYLLPLISPNLERAPVKVGDHVSQYDPALVAVVAVLAALFWKGVSGQGQFIELSKQEAMISMQRVESVTYAKEGIFMMRTGRQNPMPGGMLPCKDGYVVIVTPQEHQWEALMELMGNPDWSREEWCRDRAQRNQRAFLLNIWITEWLMQHTKEEIFKKGQALSCPVSPIYSAEDQVRSEQLAARSFFQENEHPVMGRVQFPTVPYRLSGSPWRLERSAPLLGEHNEEIYCGRLGYSRQDLQKMKEDGVI